MVAAWSPKATVQAALAMAPLTLINSSGKHGAELAEYRAWGNDIFVTAVFAIIICASIGVIAVNILTPRCLTKVCCCLRSPCAGMPSLTCCLRESDSLLRGPAACLGAYWDLCCTMSGSSCATGVHAAGKSLCHAFLSCGSCLC